MTNADDAAELLKRLIECRSITPEHGGALDIAEEVLRTAGFSVRRMPSGDVDNLWAADCESPGVLFAGHVDVVPPGDLAEWCGDPFVAAERDGYIYGRGAADMKSGVAAMLVAACNLRKSGIRGVAVLLTSDEEGDAIHGTRHVVLQLRRENAAKIPFVIVGEPTCEKEFGDTIKIGRRGSLTARIVVRGVQTHAAYPQKGDNPIHRLQSALSEVLHRALRSFAPPKIRKMKIRFRRLVYKSLKLRAALPKMSFLRRQARQLIFATPRATMRTSCGE